MEFSDSRPMRRMSGGAESLVERAVKKEPTTEAPALQAVKKEPITEASVGEALGLGAFPRGINGFNTRPLSTNASSPSPNPFLPSRNSFSPGVFKTPPPSRNPSSQGGIEKVGNEGHETTIAEPALLARMSGVASSSALARNNQSPISVNGNNLNGRGAWIPGTGLERSPSPSVTRCAGSGLERSPSPSVTRCAGITVAGNRCAHNAKDGASFCVKHTKRDGESSGGSSSGVTHSPFKSPDPIVFRCRGKTITGNQCTHNVKSGAVYCMKHGEQAWGSTTKRVEERAFHPAPTFPAPYRTPTQVYNFSRHPMFFQTAQFPPNLPGAMPAQILAPVPIQILVPISAQGPPQVPVVVPAQIPAQTQAPNAAPPCPKEEDDGAGVPRCRGRTRREEQCSFRPKSGSLYCERHTRQVREKGSLDYDMNYDGPSSSSPSGTLSASLSLRSRRSSQEVIMHMADSINTRERKRLSKAKDLFTDIVNAGVLCGNAVSTDGKDLVRWVCQEAMKDPQVAETLLGVLSDEKEKLRIAIIEERGKSSIAKPNDFWQTKYSPNLARSETEILADIQKESVRSGKKHVMLKSASGRFSSDIARDASETCVSSVQMMRQGSVSNRGTLACALCTEFFSETASLTRHWKEDHKKEASLFQKGMACCECGQEYTNKPGLIRHWRSAHPALPMVNELGVIVCMICDAMFKDFSMLWMHVGDQHSMELSSADLARRVREGNLVPGFNSMKCAVCEEEFGTQLELKNHKESAHNGSLSSPTVHNSPTIAPRIFLSAHNDSESSTWKFKCKFCGQKFKLLPDLGRHHQAEHRKPTNKPSSSKAEVLQFAPPPVKRTPLPDLESPAQSQHQNSVPVTMEWPSYGPVGDAAAQSQTFNFRHLKTIAREKRKVEEMSGDVPSGSRPVPPSVVPPASMPASLPDPLPALFPAPFVPVVAPIEQWQGQKRVGSLQNGKLVPMKKTMGRPTKQAMQIAQHMKALKQNGLQQRPDSALQPPAFNAGANAVSKMPLQRAPNTTKWPTNFDILDAARDACCKDSMYRELSTKHTHLHPQLHLQAISLLTVMGTDTERFADTFRCPNRCSSFRGVAAALPVDMAGFSEAPFKSQAGNLQADHSKDERPAPLETINIKDIIKGRSTVLHDDLSNGQEPVAIRCVIDDDLLRPCSCASCRETVGKASTDDSCPEFEYINKRRLNPSLGLDTESSKVGCACGEGRCNPAQCDHVMMFDNDNVEACDKSGVAIRGRFPYDNEGRIILEEGYMVYECNSSCGCLEDCQNRVLQKGVRVKLEVFKSRHKGWAVRTVDPIRSGTFVCEYVGEVINDREANKRGVRYDQDGCSYLYDIDAHLDATGSRAGGKPFVIDATRCGNVARFINHSCGPNLINYEVLVESMDCQLAHIGFFARRDIGAGEELSYDYRYKLLPGKGTACHCGTSACRGRLY